MFNRDVVVYTVYRLFGCRGTSCRWIFPPRNSYRVTLTSLGLHSGLQVINSISKIKIFVQKLSMVLRGIRTYIKRMYLQAVTFAIKIGGDSW